VPHITQQPRPEMRTWTRLKPHQAWSKCAEEAFDLFPFEFTTDHRPTEIVGSVNLENCNVETDNTGVNLHDGPRLIEAPSSSSPGSGGRGRPSIMHGASSSCLPTSPATPNAERMLPRFRRFHWRR